MAGKKFSHRDWYRGVSASQAPYLSEIYQRTARPQFYLIAAAVPVRDADKTVAAYFVAQHRLESLQTWLGLIKPSLAGHVWLLDKRGFLLRKPVSADQPLVDLHRDLVVQKVFSGPAGSLKGPDPVSGQMSLMSFSGAEPYGWAVLASQPFAAALNDARELQFMIWSLFALFFVALLALGFVLRKQIRRLFRG